MLRSIDRFLTNANQRAIDHSRRHRKHYTVIAGSLFLVGVIFSVWTLDLDARHIHARWFLINILLGAPAAIALNALSLQVSGSMVHASVPFTGAFRTCCLAICSNLLPVPAGSLLQASSLSDRGATALQSGTVVLMGNAFTLALLVTLAGIGLTTAHTLLGISILILGVSAIISGTAVLLSRTTARIAVAFLFLRILRTLAIILRLQLSFLVVGTTVALLDAALFSSALVLGTTFAILPAGIGISESLSALFALATVIAPSTAFLATALNRLATLAFAGTFLLIIPRQQRICKTHE